MKLLALVKPPTDPDAAARLLAERGAMTLAEARMRLAAEPPSLLARLADEAAEPLARALRKPLQLDSLIERIRSVCGG